MAAKIEIRKPRTLEVARAVGWVTFLEVIRDKVLYNIILCSILLFGLGFLASRLTFVRPDRVILDFGLSAINLSCAMIATFTGASLLAREFNNRTIYVALSHPISRPQFILGKFTGISWVLAVNWLLLSLAFIAILVGAGGNFELNFHLSLLLALSFTLLQSLLIASVAIFFSTFTTASLSAIMTIGIYLVGNNISQIRFLTTRTKSGFAQFVLNGVSLMLPNFENFNLGLKVTYGLPVSAKFVLTSSLYGLTLIMVMLFFSGLLIRGREV